MTTKRYSSREDYIITDHPEFAFAFERATIARLWPGYTERMTAEYQERIVGLVVDLGMRRDREADIEVILE